MIRNARAHWISRPTRLYAWTYRSVLSPMWERGVRGRPTYDLLSFLEATQWCSPDEIERVQVEKLRRLLTHAGARVPYYRELFARERFDPRQIRTRADLSALPVLTRDIIRERYDDLLDPASRGSNIKKGTSGSTGAPLMFEYARESEHWRRATKIRGYGWAGMREGMPSFHYWSDIPPLGTSLRDMKRRLDRALRREHFFDPMQEEEGMLAAIDELRRRKPHVIVAYTQAAALWARFILDRGLRDWDDIPVICGAEAVLPADRAALERAFGPGIFDTYGSRETMLIGAECSEHSGLHLSEENLVVEIVRDGVTLKPGQPGDVTVTDLHNYAMPFIRYVNGDVSSISTQTRCPCGRGLRKLERIDGRRSDTLRGPRGMPIPGLVFNVLLSDPTREVVRQFQVVQRASNEVILKIVKGREYSEPAFAALLARVYAQLRGLPLTVEYHQVILPGPSGKRRTVIVEKAEPAWPGSDIRA